MREEIIRMAREAGIDAWWDSGNEMRDVLQQHLERFAELVAAAERERCAKVCEAQQVHDIGHPGTAFKVQDMCAAAIRAL